jgi:hypothetical protein
VSRVYYCIQHRTPKVISKNTRTTLLYETHPHRKRVFFYVMNYGSPDRSVGAATRLRAVSPRNQDSISAKSKIVFSSPQRHDTHWRSSSLLSSRYPGLIPLR